MANIYGDAGDNYLVGTSGDDRLEGGAGVDKMEGGDGDDIYFVDHSSEKVTETSITGGNDWVYSSASFVLRANVEYLILTGTEAINGTGNELANLLVGNAGANLLNGGAGADKMEGGDGYDIYIVDHTSDKVTETSATGGIDWVHSSVDFALLANVENLTLSGSASSIGIGNALNNVIVGNDSANIIDGAAGIDKLRGGGGNDIYVVDSKSDKIVEVVGGGIDWVRSSSDFMLRGDVEYLTLTGSAELGIGNHLNNVLIGNAAANTLSGGLGIDKMKGGDGNDTYIVDNRSDKVVEVSAAGGSDTVHSSVDYILRNHVENLVLTGSASVNAIGNALDNVLRGNSGANVLSGGAGADDMKAGEGNDTYIVDNAGDTVGEAASSGNDTVESIISFTLGNHVENLVLSGNGAVNATGNALDNVLKGNDAANVLNGGAGADTMKGGGGSDTYIVDNVGDRVSELSAADGIDAVRASVSFSLGGHLENLTLSGGNAVNGTGNELDNLITGNSAANRIDGGLGTDRLIGGAGADIFAFTTSIAPANIDFLTDFETSVDRIQLGGASGQPFAALASGSLAAGAFRLGASAADADDRIIYDGRNGALSYDADGAGGAAAVQFATLSPGLALAAAHFTITGPANSLPIFSSAGTAAVQENASTSTVIYQAIAQDADGDSIVYSLEGADASRFTIDRNGAVRLVNSADYETQNVYNFTVRAVDSSGAGSARAVVLNVTDVADTAGGAPYVVTDTGVNDSAGSAQLLDRDLFTATTNANLPDPSLPSAQINGSVSAPGDLDFFTVTLQAGEQLIIDIDGTTNSLDAFVRVFGPDGSEVAVNDDLVSLDPGSFNHPDYGHNTDSFVRFRAPTSGTYTFSIGSFVDSTGQPTSSGSYTAHVSIGPVATQDEIHQENVQALIGSPGWSDLNLTYGFTTSPSQYGTNEGVDERSTGFEALNATQQAAVRTMLTQIAGVTNLIFGEVAFDPGSADLRYAMSDHPNTAHAYYPGPGNGGDSWYNNNGPLNDSTSDPDDRLSPRYDAPRVGNYAWMTFLHETGHALGLKHGHESPALSPDRDSMEYSIMTYRGYIGAPTDSENGGYRNETWGFAQTLMMYDIAALQEMYGPDFTTNSGNNVYSWNPINAAFLIDGVTQWTPGANRVFMTIWDGGGADTYDLSNFGNGVVIDLRPGEWTTTSQVQLANLGGAMARGNVANALLHNDDPRSLIENATGGSGNDTFVANQAANRLTGGAGADTFRFASSDDVGLNSLIDIISDFQLGSDRIDLSGIDANSEAESDQAFSFVGANAFTGTAGQLRYEVSGGHLQLSGDLNGDSVADFAIRLENVGSIDSSAFIL